MSKSKKSPPLPLVRSVINGVPGWSAVDTGTAPSVINSRRVTNAKLSRKVYNGEGAGDSKIRVRLAGKLLTQVHSYSDRCEYLALDLRLLEKAIGTPLIGILGISFLKNKIAAFGLEGVSFLDHVIKESRMKSMPFRFIGGTPSILVSAENTKYRAILDSGNGGELCLSSEKLASRIFPQQYAKRKERVSLGYGGKTKSIELRKVQIYLLNQSLKIERCGVYGNYQGKPPVYTFNIGYKLMKRLGMKIDYPNKKVYVESP